MKIQSENILDNLVIASPCSIPWESMQGTDRERSCAGCSRTVYNISDMTKREAEDFLRLHGTSECLRFYRRSDGTIMNDNCPRALRKIRDQYKAVSRFVTSVFALIVSMPCALGQGSDGTTIRGRSSPLLGKPARPMGGINGGAMAPTSINESDLPPRPMMDPNLIKHQPVGGSGTLNVIETRVDRDRIIWTRTEQPKNDVPKTMTANDRVETNAKRFYDKGIAEQRKGNYQLSEFYFEKALDAFDAQKNTSDRKFRTYIERELNRVRGNCSSGTSQKDPTKNSSSEPANSLKRPAKKNAKRSVN